MKKFIKIALGAAIAMSTVTTSTMALEKDKLLIWINGDKAYNGLQKIGDQFAEETGIAVKVEHPADVTEKFQAAASAGKGPDIFIWPHDRIGGWIDGGLLSPVSPSDEIKNNNIDAAWTAFTYNKKIWGYPISVEATGLIYNKDLVPNPPQSFEEMFELSKSLKKQGKQTILWDYNNTYFTMPLILANGGYAFGKDDMDMGLNNKGSVMGVSMLKSLIDEGVMPLGVDYGVMDAAFSKGEAAMIINGPWSWSNYEKAGINYGVTAIPTINGKPSRSFIGVLGAMINRSSENKELAIEFIENYMLTDDGLKTMNDDVTLGTPTGKSFFEIVKNNVDIQATMANAQAGVPMPNYAATGAFWAAMGPALQNITSGQQGVQEALDAAQKRALHNR